MFDSEFLSELFSIEGLAPISIPEDQKASTLKALREMSYPYYYSGAASTVKECLKTGIDKYQQVVNGAMRPPLVPFSADWLDSLAVRILDADLINDPKKRSQLLETVPKVGEELDKTAEPLQSEQIGDKDHQKGPFDERKFRSLLT